jgi:hypothetical protein
MNYENHMKSINIISKQSEMSINIGHIFTKAVPLHATQGLGGEEV